MTSSDIGPFQPHVTVGPYSGIGCAKPAAASATVGLVKRCQGRSGAARPVSATETEPRMNVTKRKANRGEGMGWVASQTPMATAGFRAVDVEKIRRKEDAV